MNKNDKFGLVDGVYMDARFSDLLTVLHGVSKIIEENQSKIDREKLDLINEIKIEYAD